MPDEMPSQQPKRQITPSQLRFAQLISFGAGILIGPDLPQTVNRWVFFLSFLAGLYFYYRHEKLDRN